MTFKTFTFKKINIMKNILTLVFVIALFSFTSCKNNNAETTSDTIENSTEKLYSCPMHPEVTGKLNETCSKCGMKLTEEVK